MIYPHKMKVYRVERVVDQGEVVEKFIEVYANVPCHLSQKILRSGVDSPVNGTTQEFKIFSPIEFVIKSGDKLEINIANFTYTFKAKKPFPYPAMRKFESVVEEWLE